MMLEYSSTQWTVSRREHLSTHVSCRQVHQPRNRLYFFTFRPSLHEVHKWGVTSIGAFLLQNYVIEIDEVLTSKLKVKGLIKFSAKFVDIVIRKSSYQSH